MKTSNKFLIILLAFSLFAMIGSSFSLKSKFEKLDKNDPYFGYNKKSVKPFKYIKMTGNFFGYTQIEPGKEFEIRMHDFRNYSIKPQINWTVNGDTLEINYKTRQEKFPYNSSILRGAPQVFIIAPQLYGVQSFGLISKMKGWQSEKMSVEQKGHGIVFSDNHFDDISIDLKSGGALNIEAKNVFGDTKILVKDSSSITVDKNVFKSLNLKVDSTARISLPGSLFGKTSGL